MTFARSSIAGQLKLDLTADSVVNLSELVASAANSIARLAVLP